MNTQLTPVGPSVIKIWPISLIVNFMLLLAIVSDEIDQIKSCEHVELGSNKEAQTDGLERAQHVLWPIL